MCERVRADRTDAQSRSASRSAGTALSSTPARCCSCARARAHTGARTNAYTHTHTHTLVPDKGRAARGAAPSRACVRAGAQQERRQRQSTVHARQGTRPPERAGPRRGGPDRGRTALARRSVVTTAAESASAPARRCSPKWRAGAALSLSFSLSRACVHVCGRRAGPCRADCRARAAAAGRGLVACAADRLPQVGSAHSEPVCVCVECVYRGLGTPTRSPPAPAPRAAAEGSARAILAGPKGPGAPRA